MDISPLPNIPIRVEDEATHKEILDILEATNPLWKSENVTIRVLTKGFTNKLFQCTIALQEQTLDLVVRIFGVYPILDRDTEIMAMRLASMHNLIPPVYSRFENGIVYGFSPGELMTRSQLHDEDFRRKLAHQLHSVHQIDFLKYYGKMTKPSNSTMLKQRWEKMIELDYTDVESDQRYIDNFPPMKNLYALMRDMCSVFDDLSQKYPVVFCHADAHTRNVIYNKDTGKITLLDWETFNLCPEIYDASVVYDRCADVKDDSFWGLECRRQWLLSYLSCHPLYQNSVPEEIISKWFKDSIRSSMYKEFEQELRELDEESSKSKIEL